MRPFFDYEDGDFATPISDNMAIDSDGNVLMKLGENMAVDVESGNVHLKSSWNNEDDE